MTTKAEHSQIISQHNRFIRGKAKDKAELTRRVTDEYQLAIKKYDFNPSISQEEKIQRAIKDKYDLTERRLQNIIGNRHKFLNAKQEAFTSELVMRHYIAGVNAAQNIIASLDEYEEFIDEKIEENEHWIEVEKFASAKGENIKSLTPREAKRGVLREKLDVFIKSFEPLKALAPKVIQLEDTTPRFDTLEDIREQKEQLKKELKLEEISD